MGSRVFAALHLVREFVDGLPGDTVVVSGGARGVDRAAEEAAKENGLDVVSIRPDWSRGRGAGLERNTRIVEQADAVVAFHNGVSRGTDDTIAKARAAGKPVWVIVEGRRDHFLEMEDAWRAIRGEPGLRMVAS